MRAFRFFTSIHLCDSFVPQITSFIVSRQSLQKNGYEYLTKVRSFKSAASIIIVFFVYRLGEIRMLYVTSLLPVELNNTRTSASPELSGKCTYTNKTNQQVATIMLVYVTGERQFHSYQNCRFKTVQHKTLVSINVSSDIWDNQRDKLNNIRILT